MCQNPQDSKQAYELASEEKKGHPPESDTDRSNGGFEKGIQEPS